MKKIKLKSYLNGSTTKVESQLDHIWANVLENGCKYGVTKSYWQKFTNQFILHH
jgi:hypothetical protein